MSKKQSLRLIARLRRRTDAVCKRFPQADRSVVYHTLLSLTKTPLERLNISLIRAKKRALHA
jgi:hypothetical protein